MSALVHHPQSSILTNTETSNQQQHLSHNLPKNLSKNEVQCLYDILGNRSETLATAVVQILHEDNNTWKKQACGVLCFIKDYDKRQYYFRLYDLRSKQSIFEEIVPSTLRLEKSLDRLYTFDGMKCKFGINFVDQDAAQTFYYYFHKKQENRQNKRKTHGVRQATTISQMMNDIKVPSSDAVQMAMPVSASKKQSNSKISGRFTLSRGKKKNSRLDISNPITSTFTIRNHIGLKESFFTDEAQKQLFEKVSTDMHMSEDDKSYVRNIIENSNDESNLPIQDFNQQRPEIPQRNPPTLRQDNSCRAPHQDISTPSETSLSNRFPARPICQELTIPPIPPRSSPRLPDNTCPPPLPPSLQNHNENSSACPPPIVLPEQIKSEPPTASSNTEPNTWLEDIHRFNKDKLKPASERPAISKTTFKDDSKLDPQRPMEKFIREMVGCGRPKIMGCEDDKNESSADEWSD